MRTPHALALCCGLAVSIASPAAAQNAAPPPRPQAAALPAEDAVPFAARPERIVPEHKIDLNDLAALGRADHLIFDAVLLRATPFTPEGMRIIATRYEFLVREWIKGERNDRVIAFTESGGLNPDGSGMTTEHSHNLVEGGRYIIVAHDDGEDLLLPFERVIQVLDSGRFLADEGGRLLTSARGGYITTRRTPEVASTSYLGVAPPPADAPDMGPPTFSSFPLPAQPDRPANPDLAPPIDAEELLKVLRAPGANPPADIQPAGLPGPGPQNAVDWSNCGWPGGLKNYAYWLPNTAVLPWFEWSMITWNDLVAAGGSSGYIYGRFVDGQGNPTTNTVPSANNGTNNAGTPDDTRMTAGGYGTWAANGSPNGICFQWFSGSCGRLTETDVFVNPVNNGNEDQFRKSCVHEFGHAYGANHEDRFVAIMVAGTWRVVPNYSSLRYTRVDDILGARQVMQFTNSQTPNTFNINGGWRDIATSGQSHPNWGTSGNIGPTVTTTNSTFYTTGDVATLSRMYVENRGGTGYGGPVTLKVYLSTNTAISSSDFEVYSGGWSSYGALTVSNNFSVAFPIPASVPSGTYYVGWILTSPEGELESSNNTGIMTGDSNASFAPRTIQVTNTVPANDSCANAVTVPVGAFNGNTSDATTDGSASCVSFSGKDVWYRWVAPCNGTLSASTCGSSFDTVLSVHTACGGAALACNDDACGSPLPRQSTLSTAVTGGQAYLLRVGGYASSGAITPASGAFTLSLGFTATIPANNLCASAATIIGSTSVNGSTACADAGSPGATCGSSADSPEVWYTWIPACSGLATVATCGSGYDTVISAYTDCPSAAGTLIACDDDGCGYPYSSMSFPVTANTPYRIRVSGYNGASGTFTLATSVTTGLPANDGCGAGTIAVSEGSTPVSNCGASANPLITQASCGPSASMGADVWYRYTPSASGPVTINLCDANYDSKIAVYANACPAAGANAALICNDDACGPSGLASQLAFNASAGTPYFIRVGGYLASVGTATMIINNPNACYANCDGSTTFPQLNALDFSCFLNRYRAGCN